MEWTEKMEYGPPVKGRRGCITISVNYIWKRRGSVHADLQKLVIRPSCRFKMEGGGGSIFPDFCSKCFLGGDIPTAQSQKKKARSQEL